MPVSANLISSIVRKIADVFRDAELALLRVAQKDIERSLRAPDDSPRVVSVREAFREIMDVALRKGERLFTEAVEQAEEIGTEAAVEDLVRDLGGTMDDYRDTGVNRAALRRLTAETIAPIRSAVNSALRTTDDAYREVILAATPSTVVGETARVKAAQRAMDRFADRGITGFTDRSGRRWELASYVEMATRTQLARTMVDSHADKLRSLGKNLVIVSDIRRECSLCRPWEGKILSLDGTTGDITDYNSLLNKEVVVRVAASLATARAAGLLHPNCRHNIGLYIPGVTREPQETADPEGDKANQRMRHYERQIRKWKKRKEVALDKTAEQQASQHIIQYQRLANSLAKSSGVPVQRRRQQITGAR